MTRQITIGTRASPLALAQTEQIVTALQGAVGLPAGAISVRKISTKGDEILDRTLAEIGGKGLFTDELNAGLRDGSIDLAVHSLKDLPTAETPGLFTAAIPVREDPRDILIVATTRRPDAGLACRATGGCARRHCLIAAQSSDFAGATRPRHCALAWQYRYAACQIITRDSGCHRAGNGRAQPHGLYGPRLAGTGTRYYAARRRAGRAGGSVSRR